MKNMFRRAALCVAFVAMVSVYAFLPIASPGRDNSPDETANRFFAASFADNGTLWYYEPLNFIAGDVVYPRSMRVVQDFVVPGGFIGFPVLAGLVARVATMTYGAPLLTPLLAALAVLAFGSLVAMRFGRRAGIIAGALLAVQPVWWYWASRTFMPNVPFVAFLLFAAWFAAVRPLHRLFKERLLASMLDDVVAGASLALALAVRTSELPWLVIALVPLAIAMRRHLVPRRLLAAAFGLVAVTVPFLILQGATYGSVFATGYGSQAVPADLMPQGLGARLLGPLGRVLFPLGFAPRTAFVQFIERGISFHWWWAEIVVVASVLLAMRVKAWDRRVRLFAASLAAAGLWLVAFYGSYLPPDAGDIPASVGMSVLRYWLPLFVASVVPVAVALDRFASRFRRPAVAVVATVVAIGIAGAASVFVSPREGLFAVRDALARDEALRQQVVAATAPGDVIVVDRADKFLFPSRKVIQPLRSDSTFAALGKLRGKATTYYFGVTFPERDIEYLRQAKLGPLGLDIEEVRAFDGQTLYRIEPTDVAR
jgi:hypothetical protein